VATSRTAAAVALQQPHRNEEEYRETLSIIEQQTTRLTRIVEDMFTLARADAGSYPVRRTLMYLDEVVDDVVRAARVLADTKQVTIQLATIQSASFSADEELVRRLVGNLLDNAVRHAPSNSVVQVSLQEEAGNYVLSVSDAGEGIPAEIQPFVFERFVRGDAARSSAGGAGLGLALARWIARAHGGDVALVRSSPEGTTLSAVLPSRS
jgi:two-component system OmpR family sensor kinase